MIAARRRRWIRATLLGLALAAVPVAASADTPPSVWDRARDSDAADAFELHQAVHRRLLPTRIAEVDFAERGRALAMLERAGAERSKNPLLRFDLGIVYSLLENHRRAVQVLKAAIAEFPVHPMVDRAWLLLAFSCGHLGDHACEEASYVEVLRRETEEIVRATPTLNLAETRMHLGDLKDAIEGYREALRIAGRVPARETAPLATWGLAVALDRSGDRVGAEKEARFAVELERSMGVPRLLRSTNVFFVPDYEIYWYEGLGAMATARQSRSPRQAVQLWKHAVLAFAAYVKAAEPKQDRWLPIARARLAHVRGELSRAEKVAGPEPRAPEPSEFEVTF